jgi:hypothetical protein
MLYPIFLQVTGVSQRACTHVTNWADPQYLMMTMMGLVRDPAGEVEGVHAQICGVQEVLGGGGVGGGGQVPSSK